MKIGKVIGRVVLSKKDENLSGGFLLIVSPLDKGQFSKNGEGMSKLTNLVVYDTLGAVHGDLVSYVEGAEATAPFDRPIPIDAYNVGIVDKLKYIP